MTPQQIRSAQIAAGLLRLHPEDVMDYIGCMSEQEKATLRDQVAWVNDYEAHEGAKK